jgi:methylmalonyl-CoA mutase N-terminal domain/subunit
MPKILDAVKQYATLGEIAGTLEEVFGVHKESVVL